MRLNTFGRVRIAYAARICAEIQVMCVDTIDDDVVGQGETFRDQGLAVFSGLLLDGVLAHCANGADSSRIGRRTLQFVLCAGVQRAQAHWFVFGVNHIYYRIVLALVEGQPEFVIVVVVNGAIVLGRDFRSGRRVPDWGRWRRVHTHDRVYGGRINNVRVVAVGWRGAMEWIG